MPPISRMFTEILRNFPTADPCARPLGPIARIKLVYPHVVIYDCDAGDVTVLRVLHGRRNITADLMKRERP